MTSKTIVELVGVPGSGKTAVARAIRPTFRTTGLLPTIEPLIYRRRARGMRLFMQVRFQLQNWPAVAPLNRVSFRMRSPQQLGQASRVAVDAARLRYAAQQLPLNTFVILDQGLLQQLIRFLSYVNPPDTVDLTRQVVGAQVRMLEDWARPGTV